MYALITTFYVSLIGVILMLLLKRHELKSGKATVVSRFGRGTDKIFGAVFSKIKLFHSYFNRKNLVAMAQWLAFHVLLRVRKVYVEIKHRFISNPHGKKLIDAVRGRGEVHNHGASFYLRRISER